MCLMRWPSFQPSILWTPFRSSNIGCWYKKMEEDWNFNRVELPLQVFIYCTFSEESKRRQRSFRFISFSFSWDNAWFNTAVMALLHVLGRCQDYQATGRFLTSLKQRQQHWKIDMMLWGFPKELNKLWREERLKDLPWIPEQWWEVNQEMTLKVGNHSYMV